MTRVILDIETLGFPLESFDEAQQTYLLKFAQSEQEKTETIQKFSLYPTTAQILAIGMLNPDTRKGKVLFQSDERVDTMTGDETANFVSGNEKEILEKFWE